MNILAAVDDSTASENVLDLALTHAKAFNAKIYVMRSMKQDPELKKEDIDRAERKLEKMKTLFKAEDIPCDSIVSVCSLTPGEDLVEFANENDMNEIIIGVRKKSKVGKLVFGSTAQYVILKAPCPVVTVK